MSDTLQKKIDNYPNPHVIYKKDLNKALQEFREQIKTFNTDCDCPLCNERTRIIKNVLALLGEKHE